MSHLHTCGACDCAGAVAEALPLPDQWPAHSFTACVLACLQAPSNEGCASQTEGVVMLLTCHAAHDESGVGSQLLLERCCMF